MTLSADDATAYCACHNQPAREGYLCTRCSTRVCRLPAECPACGLTLILSTHLARSYHHLFPLRNWIEVSWEKARASKACYACQSLFPEPPKTGKAHGGASNGVVEDESDAAKQRRKELTGVSESGRYMCQVCSNHFCIDCDVFAHEVIHNCPGCQSNATGQAVNGGTEANGAMEIDP